MQNFPDNNLENIGGILSFNFIPLYDVDDIPFVTGNTLATAVSLKSGKSWYTGISLLKTAQFEEKINKGDAGKLIKYKFSGVYPGQSATMDELLNDMEPVPMILDVTDNNGIRRLLGAIDNGVDFSYEYKSGQTPSHRPEYSFEFTWNSLVPALFYNI